MRARRLELGIEQKDLAELVGASASSLCRWEQGEGLPDFITGIKISAALGFDPVALAMGMIVKMKLSVDKRP